MKFKTKTGKVSKERVLNKKRRAREERALAKVKKVTDRVTIEQKAATRREARIMFQAKKLGISVPGKENDIGAIYKSLQEFCKNSKRHTAV